MKIWEKFKNILIILLIAILIIYGAIYFLLPQFLNKKDYSSLVTDFIAKETGLVLLIDDYKLSVEPNLNIDLNAKNIRLFYPNKQQILDIKNIQIGLSTFALIKQEIKINKLNALEFQFSTKLLKNGKTTLSQYLENNVKIQKNQFKFSKNFPKTKVSKYILKIKDEESNQLFKFVGNNFELLQNLDYRFVDAKTNGKFYCAEKLFINYDAKYTIPKALFKNVNTKLFDINLNNLYKQNFQANVHSDIKIHMQNNEFAYISGFVNVDKFIINLNGYKLPPSYFHITADKGYANLVSKLYTNKTDVSHLKAKIKLSKPNHIELECNCPKADLNNIQKILIPILDILKIKNNLKDCTINGDLNANFKLITDLKSIKSNGKFIIKNGKIKHKSFPLIITNENTAIDFSNNIITLKNANILVNNQPLKVDGQINQDSTCNLVITANNLDLKNITKAFPTIFEKVLKTTTINSGKIRFIANVQGKLLEAKPKIKLTIEDFSILEKISNTKINTKKIDANINADNAKQNGTITLNTIEITPNNLKNITNRIKSEKLIVKFDNKDLTITPSKFTTGNANFSLSGQIKNYKETPESNLIASGTIDTNFLKSLIPNNLVIYNNGYIPFRASIKGKSELTNGNIQLLANQQNYITPFYIRNLENKNSLTNIQFNILQNNINISDFSLNYAENIENLIKEVNPSKLKKIILIKGKIKQDLKSVYKFENLKMQSLEGIKVEIKSPYQSKALLNFNTTLNGSTDKPTITGYLELNNIITPKLKLNINNILANLTSKNVNLKIANINIDDTSFSSNIDLPANFANSKTINNVQINANEFNLDKIIGLSYLLPQSKFAPGVDFPYTINSGNLQINTFKTGPIKAENINSKIKIKNNKLYLESLTGNAYSGNIAGKIDYDFGYSTINAIIQGRKLNASQASQALIPKEHHISGELNFDSNIKMYGNTQKQQMESLTGKTEVVIRNGHLGQLGRFEHFLYAQNLLSQKFINASLNSAKQAISPQNTGNFSYLKGTVNLKNEYAYLEPIITSGQNMSMYITGNIGLNNDIADLTILGKISSEVSNSLGILGNITIKDLIDEHTKQGKTIENLFNFYHTELPEIDISKIPNLTPELNKQTKNFKVIISGNTKHVSSVKSFTWVNPIGTKSKLIQTQTTNKPSSIEKTTIKNDNQKTQESSSINSPQVQNKQLEEKLNTSPDFLNSIPDTFN